jgi:hypothetical protein
MIIGKAISPFAIKRRNGGGGGTDADAQAFITASGISGTEATATNQLVIDLKAANIWTKMKAVYPMVGGSATSCKWNLKNPVDSNAAYRLVFSGGGTFSANGYQPNGVNAFADTFFTPATNGLLNSSHISFYSRTNSDGVFTDFAGANLAPNGATLLYIKSSNILYGTIDLYASTIPEYLQGTNTDSRGFYSLSRTASNLSKAYKNGSILATQTNSGNRTFSKLLISSNNSTQFSNRECAFASIGDGLTDAEALAFYNAVQTFNTTLARQV